ncbi:MAG: carboxypeptidase-like regulatory domain-containing protein, partial [Candidatus Bathyarchaeota archaeon]
IVLEGTIIDPEGKPAIYDISVLGGGMNTNISTRSGQDGKFEYSNLPIGEYLFSCRPRNQYEPLTLVKAVEILKDKKTILKIRELLKV